MLADNIECVWPVHRNWSMIVTGSQNLLIFLPRGMRSLFIGYCAWSFSHYPITDNHVVYIWEGYLDCSLPSQNTCSVWNPSTKMSQATILSFYGSNFYTIFPVLYIAFNYLKICVPSKSDLYPKMLNQRVHVPLNQNVSGNAGLQTTMG